MAIVNLFRSYIFLYSILFFFLSKSWNTCILRHGASAFTLADVQEIEAIISTFNAFETKEAGPLILAWAVFLCLSSSLPGKEENNILMVCDMCTYCLIFRLFQFYQRLLALILSYFTGI